MHLQGCLWEAKEKARGRGIYLLALVLLEKGTMMAALVKGPQGKEVSTKTEAKVLEAAVAVKAAMVLTVLAGKEPALSKAKATSLVAAVVILALRAVLPAALAALLVAGKATEEGGVETRPTQVAAVAAALVATAGAAGVAWEKEAEVVLASALQPQAGYVALWYTWPNI